MAKKKSETIENILDRIMEDIDSIRDKCVCNGDESYGETGEEDDLDFDDEDRD